VPKSLDQRTDSLHKEAGDSLKNLEDLKLDSWMISDSYISNILGQRIDILDQEAGDSLENLKDLELDPWMISDSYIANILGQRIDSLDQEAGDSLENLDDLELDFADEDLLECDNMRGIIQASLTVYIF